MSDCSKLEWMKSMDKVNNRQTNSYTYSTTSPAFGTPLFRGHLYSGDTSVQGHKIWSQKNVDIIFVFATSIEGTPLFRGKGHFFWVLGTP